MMKLLLLLATVATALLQSFCRSTCAQSRVHKVVTQSLKLSWCLLLLGITWRNSDALVDELQHKGVRFAVPVTAAGSSSLCSCVWAVAVVPAKLSTRRGLQWPARSSAAPSFSVVTCCSAAFSVVQMVIKRDYETCVPWVLAQALGLRLAR